jgi:hypothetical protein
VDLEPAYDIFERLDGLGAVFEAKGYASTMFLQGLAIR